MAHEVDLGDDDGFMTMTIQGVSNELDVWHVNNLIHENHKKLKDRPDAEYNDGLAALIESLGYPRCSRRMAQMFVEAIAKRVKELAGNA